MLTRFRHRLSRPPDQHPSLVLPSFPVCTPTARHWEAGRARTRLHGLSSHRNSITVPIIIQAAVPGYPATVRTPLAKGASEEHRIYPQAVRWLCEDRVTLTADGQVTISGARPAAHALLSPALDV